MSKEKGIAILAAFFYVFGPIVPLLFRFSDGLYLIAFSFLPFILLLYSKFLQPQKRGRGVLLCLLIAFVILIDSLILPTLFLGMAAIFLAQVGWKRAEEKIKQSFLVLSFAFLVATLWYTPGYWLTLLGAPSLAGKGLAGVIFQLGKLLPIVLAFGIAIFSVRFFKKKNLLRDFCFYWLFIFGFLTLLRFLSDPDFWMDWTAYSLELQFGVAIAMGILLGKKAEDRRQRTEGGLQKAEDRGRMVGNRFSVFGHQYLSSIFCFPSSILFALYFLLFAFIFNRYLLGTLQRDISQTVEYRVGRQLSEIAKDGDRVFLSGTTAFWLNSLDFCPDHGKTRKTIRKDTEECVEVAQVRGGVDQAAVDQEWRKAVWEIREGAEVEKSIEWLKSLDVSYLVVHTEDSEEFYHDFKYPEKFEGVEGFEKVYDEQGDIIYRVED